MTAGGRALTAAFLLALAPAPGCSWVFVRNAPQRPVPAQPPVKCTSSKVAPDLDAGIGVVLGLAGIVGTSVGGAGVESNEESGAAWALLGGGLAALGLALVYILSANHGFENTKACQELMDAQTACLAGVEASCRALVEAPPPPPPEVPATLEAPAASPAPQETGRPNVGDPCRKPEDCRGGARCLLDDLGNGTCVEPEPVTPPPGR